MLAKQYLIGYTYVKVAHNDNVTTYVHNVPFQLIHITGDVSTFIGIAVGANTA